MLSLRHPGNLERGAKEPIPFGMSASHMFSIWYLNFHKFQFTTVRGKTSQVSGFGTWDVQAFSLFIWTQSTTRAPWPRAATAAATLAARRIGCKSVESGAWKIRRGSEKRSPGLSEKWCAERMQLAGRTDPARSRTEAATCSKKAGGAERRNKERRSGMKEDASRSLDNNLSIFI